MFALKTEITKNMSPLLTKWNKIISKYKFGKTNNIKKNSKHLPNPNMTASKVIEK